MHRNFSPQADPPMEDNLLQFSPVKAVSRTAATPSWCRGRSTCPAKGGIERQSCRRPSTTPLAWQACDHAFGVASFRLVTNVRAFTLIELVVTIVIIGIMAVITVQYLATGAQVYTLLLAQQQAEGGAMGVVKRMRRETRTLQAIITADSSQWTFRNLQGGTNVNTCGFQLSGGDVLLNSNILARNVQTFALTYYDATNGSPTNLSLISRVALELKVTNAWAASEMNVNFFLQDGYLK